MIRRGAASSGGSDSGETSTIEYLDVSGLGELKKVQFHQLLHI